MCVCVYVYIYIYLIIHDRYTLTLEVRNSRLAIYLEMDIYSCVHRKPICVIWVSNCEAQHPNNCNTRPVKRLRIEKIFTLNIYRLYSMNIFFFWFQCSMRDKIYKSPIKCYTAWLVFCSSLYWKMISDKSLVMPSLSKKVSLAIGNSFLWAMWHTCLVTVNSLCC